MVGVELSHRLRSLSYNLLEGRASRRAGPVQKAPAHAGGHPAAQWTQRPSSITSAVEAGLQLREGLTLMIINVYLLQ